MKVIPNTLTDQIAFPLIDKNGNLHVAAFGDKDAYNDPFTDLELDDGTHVRIEYRDSARPNYNMSHVSKDGKMLHHSWSEDKAYFVKTLNAYLNNYEAEGRVAILPLSVNLVFHTKDLDAKALKGAVIELHDKDGHVTEATLKWTPETMTIDQEGDASIVTCSRPAVMLCKDGKFTWNPMALSVLEGFDSGCIKELCISPAYEESLAAYNNSFAIGGVSDKVLPLSLPKAEDFRASLSYSVNDGFTEREEHV